MKHEQIQIEFQVFENKNELAVDEQNLLDKAWEAVDLAYAPYSHFKVGAAVELENGEIVQGNNQENAAYPSGLCAERVALFFASSKFPNEAIQSIAIVAKSSDFTIEGALSPCGSCRQVIAEYEFLHHKPIKIIMDGGNGLIYRTNSIKNLLPLAFYEENLKKNINE